MSMDAYFMTQCHFKSFSNRMGTLPPQQHTCFVANGSVDWNNFSFGLFESALHNMVICFPRLRRVFWDFSGTEVDFVNAVLFARKDTSYFEALFDGLEHLSGLIEFTYLGYRNEFDLVVKALDGADLGFRFPGRKNNIEIVHHVGDISVYINFKLNEAENDELPDF